MNPMSSILSEKETKKCFANISNIHNLNKSMYEALKPWHPNKPIIQTLLEFAPYFKLYFDYCNNYMNMLGYLEKWKKTNQKFKAYVQETEKKSELRGMEIVSFLVKPV